MDSSNTSGSAPSSSPTPSPRTDTMQYTAFHDTQGDWHDMTCSPSNCNIYTTSPHAHFSSQKPPSVNYIPQFDYELHPNLSPLHTMNSPYNYPNPNMTFYNPYMSKSCKRALNTSSSSICSRSSPQNKRQRQNLSTCSRSTNQSVITCLSLDQSQLLLELDQTCRATTPADSEVGGDCSNNNMLCENCPDLLPVVAVCRTCQEQPALCQLCFDAHKRVKLTREHMVHIIGEQSMLTRRRSVPQVLQSIVELICIDKKLAKVDLNDTIAITTAELKRIWSVNSDTFSEKELAQDRRNSEEVIEANLIPVFFKGSLEVKVKAAAIIQLLIEIKVANVTSAFANDNCIEGFDEMLNAEDSYVVVAALNCLESLVKEIVELGAKFSLIKLHSKLEKQLRSLKESEAGYNTSVQFKAGKLIRGMEKCLME